MTIQEFDQKLTDLIHLSDGCSIADVVAALEIKKVNLLIHALSNSAHTPAPSVSGDEQTDKSKQT